MLKMKPQHREQGNREHVLCVQCTMNSVQYILVRENSTYSSTVCAVMSQCPSFFEVGSIQALKNANEILMYERG